MRKLHLTVANVTVALILLSSTALAQDSTTYKDVPRFQQVTENLYRGGQPRQGGINKLRELGINTVINLRGASDRTRAEEKEARGAGLNYFNVSLPNWGRPQDTRVSRILELISAPENGRVFIHCKDGVDRTGMIVAMYRMTHDGWTSTQALAEAERLGMRRTQVWMRDYAEDYGERVHKLGPETALKSPGVHEDFDDRVGTGMRFVERGAFTARKFARRFFRKLR
ncbi:MAG TPA: dual specificity protein phosphatase family protein [Pyrinomonadaceae bacterium]|nr:dual specificity protein phosphatase family protein [Pyrinomonadaceae bacterium]